MAGAPQPVVKPPAASVPNDDQNNPPYPNTVDLLRNRALKNQEPDATQRSTMSQELDPLLLSNDVTEEDVIQHIRDNPDRFPEDEGAHTSPAQLIEMVRKEKQNKKEAAPLKGLAPAPGPDSPTTDDIDAFLLSINNQQDDATAEQQAQELMGTEPVDEGFKANALKPLIPKGGKPAGKVESLARTATEMAYTAPLKGLRDAAQETIDLVINLDQGLAALTKDTPFEFLGRPPGSPKGTPLVKEGDLQLPDPGDTTTTFGGIEKNIVQFVAGFVGAGKITKPIKLLEGAPLTEAGIKSFISTFAAFDGHQERLSNLIQNIDPKWRPGVIDTVTSYLQAEEDDPELLGRLKGSLEDAGFGLLLEPALKGIQAIRAATRAKTITKATTFEEAAKQITTDYGAILKAENQPIDQVDNLLGPTQGDFVHKPNEMPADLNTPPTVDEAGNVIPSTSGEVPAGLAPVQYGDTTVHVNFNKIDTPEDLAATIKELNTHRPQRADVDPLKLTEPSAYVIVNKRMFTGTTREEAIAKVAKQYGPNSDQVKRLQDPGNEQYHGTFDPAMGFTGAQPDLVMKDAGVFPQPTNPFVDAKVTGSEATWDLMMNSRAKRIANGQSTPLRAEDQEALKALYVAASNKLDEVIKVAQAAPTSENLFAFRKMLSTFGIINNELRGIRHETNRAINIWRKSETVPMRRMKDIEETLERTGGIEDNKKLLDTIAIHLQSDKQAGLALANMAIASRRYGTVRAIRNFWTLGLLTNWKTHEVNAISNTFMMFQLAAERAAAAKYTQALGIQGGVAPGEASAMLSGMWQSLGDAMRNAGRTFRTGEGGGAFNKMETPFEHNVFEDSDTALKKFVNTSMWYWGGIGRALQASDEFFKTLNMSAAVNAEIQRKAYWEVQAGKLSKDKMAERITALKNDVPEEILLKAEDLSRYATFTKEPGAATKAFSRWINKVPGGRYIIPFINTPSNLFNASIERTPFAPLQKTFRDAIRRGGADEALAMSKMSMGTSLMAMSMNATFDGLCTGSGPPFWSKEYARWKATGRQPYSCKKGDKWIAYNRFDPNGMVLGLGGDIAERIQSIDDSDSESLADVQKILAGATFSVISQVTSKTYMQGATNVFEALNNPEINANTFVQMFAGSLVPSGVGELTRQIDPIQRQTYDFVTKWKSRVPGLSSTLEPKLDQWGREMKYGTGSPVIDAINPINITKENFSPIDREFDLQGWSIPKDVTDFTVDKSKINLKAHPEIHTYVMKLSRQTPPSEMGDPNNKAIKKLLRKYGDYSMFDVMNMIITGNHPMYRKYATKSDGPTGDKVNMLKSIYKDYNDAAKDMAMEKFPELQLEVIDKADKRDAKAKDIATERLQNPAPVMPVLRVPNAAGDTQ